MPAEPVDLAGRWPTPTGVDDADRDARAVNAERDVRREERADLDAGLEEHRRRDRPSAGGLASLTTPSVPPTPKSDIAVECT